jgi:hypothetical protein
MKKMHVNSRATRSDFWKELFPVPLEEALQAVTENASKRGDRSVFNVDGLMKRPRCLCGGRQFAKGIGAWATTQKGMMPPPNFGRATSNDKFKRWNRCLAEGPTTARASE